MSEAEAVFMKLLAAGVFSIDDQGRVFRHRRIVRGFGGTKPKPNWVFKDIPRRRAETAFPEGYPAVYVKRGDKQCQVKAHRVVWMSANNEDISPGMQINHKNGVRNDNRPENLEVVTPSENRVHAALYLNPRKPFQFGEDGPRAILTEGQVRAIRALRGKMLQRDIALRFGISRQNVSMIHLRKSWPHIE